jgi:polar amino acid transport system substrate-binding protein
MRKINRFIAAAITGAFLMGAALTATAQESKLDVVKKRGTLIAGVKADYPPFGYTDQNGEIVGFDIRVMTYFAQKLGVKLDLRPVTSANRIPMLMNGTIDIVAASMTITTKREQVVDFSIPYVLIGTQFLVKKDSGIGGWADLDGKTVVYTQGTPWGDKIKKEVPSAKHLVFQDKPQAVLAVAQGKADAYVDDAAPLYVYVKQQGSGDLHVTGEATIAMPMGLGVQPNDSKWRDFVNFTLVEMWNDGSYAAAYRSEFGVDPNPDLDIYPWAM